MYSYVQTYIHMYVCISVYYHHLINYETIVAVLTNTIKEHTQLVHCDLYGL